MAMEKMTYKIATFIDDFQYQEEAELSVIENLVQEHNLYDAFEQNYQNGAVKAAIKKGEIYIKAKVELGTNGQEASNQTIGNHFKKSEATIRNYISIYNNRDMFETPVSSQLSIRQMIKKIRDKTSEAPKKEPKKKAVVSHKDRKIFELEEENNSLKEELQSVFSTPKVKTTFKFF